MSCFVEQLVEHGIKLCRYKTMKVFLFLSFCMSIPLRHNCSNFERQNLFFLLFFRLSETFQNKSRTHLEPSLLSSKINYSLFEKGFSFFHIHLGHTVCRLQKPLHCQHTNGIFWQVNFEWLQIPSNPFTTFFTAMSKSTITDKIIA